MRCELPLAIDTPSTKYLCNILKRDGIQDRPQTRSRLGCRFWSLRQSVDGEILYFKRSVCSFRPFFSELIFFLLFDPTHYSGGIMLCCGVLTWGSSDEGIFEARLLLLDSSPSTPKIDMFNGDVVECQSQNSNDIEKRKFIFCTTLIMQNNTKSKYSQRG